MARNKEMLVLLLDVGRSMHQHLEYTAKAVSALVHRKLVHSKFDEVGVVYFGADDTENELSSSGLDGYENIVVARPISVVSSDLATTVEKLPKGSGVADFMSAVVMGMDMIVKKMGVTSKGNKRICLITDGETPVRDPEEGDSKEEEAVNLAEQMQKQAMTLDAVLVRPRPSGEALQSSASKENEFLLTQISSRTKGGVIVTKSYASLLGSLRTRLVSPTSLYRGDLELTPTLSVQIRVYKKVSPERFPTMKIFSDKAPRTDSQATHVVMLDTEYKSAVDLDTTIPPEQRVKAYKYGPQFVPISARDEEALKFKPEKGVKLIGFTDATNVPRHYFMKDANVFLPEAGNARAELAISCLARAMDKAQMVAIVRCVWRAGQTNVVLGILTPNLSTEDDTADCLYFNILPFAEDLREYQFASFKNRSASSLPTTAQQEAVDALVQNLDLASDALEEKLRPERTVNPVLQRFYSFLHAKSVNPDADVPPIDDVLRPIVEPEQLLLPSNELQNFREQFPFSRNMQKKGQPYWQEGLEGGELPPALPAPGEEPMQEDGGKPLGLEFLINKKVDDVGSVNPVQDFEAMLARRDSSEWVSKAIKGMKKIISDLLSSAYNGNTFEKAMSCLVALRAGCVIQEEPAEFNSFLQETAKHCQSKRLRDFWELVISKDLTLISKDEAPDSEVTQDEAASFLKGQTSPGKNAPPEDEVDEMEALLDDVI